MNEAGLAARVDGIGARQVIYRTSKEEDVVTEEVEPCSTISSRETYLEDWN